MIVWKWIYLALLPCFHVKTISAVIHIIFTLVSFILSNLANCFTQLGHEREAAVCLMQKFLSMRSQDQDLQIKSAVALDHLKGYLYVEAEKEAYVKQVIFPILVPFPFSFSKTRILSNLLKCFIYRLAEVYE